MGTSFKRSPAHTAALSAPSPGSRPLSTHPSTGDSWTLMGKSGSVSCGSLFLSSGSWCAQVLFVPPESLFPQSCVSSGGSMVGLMVTSSNRAYVIPRSAPPRVHAPAAGHCRPVPLQETLKHFWLSLCGVSGSWCTQGLSEPSEHLWRVRGLIVNAISPLLPCRWGFSFALGCGVSFFGAIQQSPVDGCSSVSCSFGVLTGEDVLYMGLFLHFTYKSLISK